jgi:hypothetical protein
MHFFDHIDLPFTKVIETITATERRFDLHKTTFTSGGGQFTIRKLDSDHLVIEVSKATSFPANFYKRVLEALWYVSAYPAKRRVFFATDGSEETFRLSSPRTESTRANLKRPLHSAGLRDPRMFWRLFSKYLEFVTRDARPSPSSKGCGRRKTKHSGWHPCSIHIYNAIEASANSFNSWALGLCVAVEGIANLVEFREDPLEKQRVCKLTEFRQQVPR